jgi:hypothetical protein
LPDADSLMAVGFILEHPVIFLGAFLAIILGGLAVVSHNLHKTARREKQEG